MTIQEGHQLITTGPYKLVRHPCDLGVMLVAVGVSLVFRAWAGLLVSPAVLWVLVDRIKDEEAVMHQESGAAWARYTQATWRMVPYVY